MSQHRPKNFDIIIVGGGPAGLFAAWQLAENSGAKVLLLEKGKGPGQRACPMSQWAHCTKCRPCNILCGIGGAGLFSDGKLNFIHKLGKTDLTQWMPRPQAEALIAETEVIFSRFGMDAPAYPTDMAKAESLRRKARTAGIELLLIRQKHLGTDHLPGHITRMAEAIAQRGVTIRTGEEVLDVLVDEDPKAPGQRRVAGVVTAHGAYRVGPAGSVILAPGRVGAEWVGKLAGRLGLAASHRGIEVGVRVEVHNDIYADVTDIIYDPTFFVQTPKYDDSTRTFCTNPGGYVALENYQDFVCVNGHAFMDKKSENTNFAFLSKVVLTEPVTDNQAYGESIGRLATLIGGGKPILQRFGDLKRGRRSTWGRIRNGYIEPTLTAATPGDIAMALPERILTNLLQGLEKLGQVVPGVANDETLLYAPEIKFFATQIETDNTLQTAVAGLHVAGDGPGVAGNIVSAAATGILAARGALSRLGAKAPLPASPTQQTGD